MAASTPGAESFTIDLFDNSVTDPTTVIRPSSLSPLCVDHDSAGMLAINVPPKSCHTLCFDFIGAHSSKSSWDSSKAETEHLEREGDDEPVDDDESVKKTHSTLRKFHRAIFDEQVDSIAFTQNSRTQDCGLSFTDVACLCLTGV